MYKTFAEVTKALSSGVKVLDIVQHYLHVIEQQKELNAFLEVFENSALEQAKIVDEKINNGR